MGFASFDSGEDCEYSDIDVVEISKIFAVQYGFSMRCHNLTAYNECAKLYPNFHLMFGSGCGTIVGTYDDGVQKATSHGSPTSCDVLN